MMHCVKESLKFSSWCCAMLFIVRNYRFRQSGVDEMMEWCSDYRAGRLEACRAHSLFGVLLRHKGTSREQK